MRKLMMFVCALQLTACGSEPVGKDTPVVIVSDNNMSMPNGTTENNTDAPDCCAGLECGSAPGCEESCGSCGEAAFCDAGTCVEAAADAPRIIDFSTNVTTITPSGDARFSAIVTDPDGIDDVIGGTLKSPDGASYGAFQTASAEGSYQLNVSWAELNTVKAITFETSVDRTFIAEFFDQVGNKVQAEVTLTLQCSNPATESACSPGVCTDTATSAEHCGSCGNDITEIYNAFCDSGVTSCRNAEEYCSAQRVCSYYEAPETCGGVCGNDCARLAPILGVTLDDDNYVSCDGSVCEIRIWTTNPAPCNTQCGPLTCRSGSASYEESGLSAGCATRWDDPDNLIDYGNLIGVSCTCEE